jgi:hypothetical protein
MGAATVHTGSIGPIPIPLPNPAGDIGSALLHALGSAVVGGISHAAGWALAGLLRALTATTSVDVSPADWFGGPWRAMVSVAALVSIPILVIGVTAEALAGRPGEAAKRALVAPAVIAVGTVAAPAVAGGVLALVSACCDLLVNEGAGGQKGLATAFARLPTDVGAAAGPQLPVVVAALLAVLVGVLAFVIWVELAARAGLLYLVVLFAPLGLAGLWWRHTTVWLRRLVEVFVAVAISQLVITAAMVLAAAALAHGRLNPTAPGSGVDTLVAAVGLLLLGTFGLPMALRVIPHAAEGVIAGGVGARTLGRAGGAGRQAAAGTSAALGSSSTAARLSAGAAAGGPAGVAAAAVVAGAAGVRRLTTAGINGAAASSDTATPSATAAPHAGGGAAAGTTAGGPRPATTQPPPPPNRRSTNGANGQSPNGGPR